MPRYRLQVWMKQIDTVPDEQPFCEVNCDARSVSELLDNTGTFRAILEAIYVEGDPEEIRLRKMR